jgi:hypothetical protein
MSALERAKLVVAEMEQLCAVGGKLDLRDNDGRRTPVRVVSVDSSKVSRFPCLAAVLQHALAHVISCHPLLNA